MVEVTFFFLNISRRKTALSQVLTMSDVIKRGQLDVKKKNIFGSVRSVVVCMFILVLFVRSRSLHSFFALLVGLKGTC